MVLVIFTILSWLFLMLFYVLPNKLPKIVNFLTYMGLSIIDINKWTLLYSKYHYLQLSKDKIYFFSFVLYRDIISSFILLMMVNVFFAAKNKTNKFGSLFISYILLLLFHQLLKHYKIVTYIKWNTYYEITLLFMMIFITLGVGYTFQRIYQAEEKRNENHNL